jgi:hypothetical protein
LSASLFGQYSQIPDSVFEQKLIELGYDDIIDGQVLSDNIFPVTELNLQNYEQNEGITDLTGIADFPFLEYLSFNKNSIEQVDLSSNVYLEYLYGYENNLNSINLIHNDLLQEVYLYDNPLQEINVGGLIYLETLYLHRTELTELDVSSNISLDDLYAHECDLLNCLNVANNNPSLFFSVYDNANLNCIEVNDETYANNEWSFVLDTWMVFSEDCGDCNVGVTELATSKSLIQILDMMGRETSFKPNTPLIYVYDDGSIEKVFRVEY